jgi:hypothetical protein
MCHDLIPGGVEETAAFSPSQLAPGESIYCIRADASVASSRQVFSGPKFFA